MSTWTKPRRKGSCWATPIVDAPPLHTPLPAVKSDPFLIDLPLGQKMVLLKLRKGELAAAILDKLKAMSAPEPVKADWSACIEASYIRRSFAHSNTGRLELLPPGLSAVNAIMRDLAPKYDIHLFKRSGGHETRTGAISRCSCGWSSGPHRLTRNVEFVQARHENAHLDMVASGSWKPARPLHEFLNEVMPPRFDFSATQQTS